MSDKGQEVISLRWCQDCPDCDKACGMEGSKEFSEALKFWMRKLKLTQMEFAERIGASQNHISQLCNGNKLPSFQLISAIASFCGGSVRDFFSIPRIDPTLYYFVPKVKAVPRAGNGGLQTDGDFEGWYGFRTSYLIGKGNVEEMRLFSIEGDSMEPTLLSGDMIMIDQSQNKPVSGNIFLIGINDELMVKRLFAKPTGITIFSDNKEFYPAYEITNEHLDSLVIYGRMRWSGRDYK